MLANSDLTNLPLATWVYLALYILTMFVHFVFMAYVLGGGVYLLFSMARPRNEHAPASLAASSNEIPTLERTSPPSSSNTENRSEDVDHTQASNIAPRATFLDPVSDLLRDWMPFAISAAITAGVAPLLFIQILYQHRFYTANLLLSHRWMAIVPVLIAAFYLAYIIKSGRFERMGRMGRMSLLGIVASCFLFVAWSWTENHLLSLDRARWESFYVEGRWLCRSIAIVPRLLMWIALTLAIMPQLVRWQLWAKRDAETQSWTGRAHRRLNAVSLLGILCATLLLMLTNIPYVEDNQLPTVLRGAASWLTVVGGVALIAFSLAIYSAARRAMSPESLRPGLFSTLALSLYVLVILCLRELHRLSSVELSKLIPHHQAAAESAGALVFVVFTVINLVLAALCIRIARRAMVDR